MITTRKLDILGFVAGISFLITGIIVSLKEKYVSAVADLYVYYSPLHSLLLLFHLFVSQLSLSL